MAEVSFFIKMCVEMNPRPKKLQQFLVRCGNFIDSCLHVEYQISEPKVTTGTTIDPKIILHVSIVKPVFLIPMPGQALSALQAFAIFSLTLEISDL